MNREARGGEERERIRYCSLFALYASSRFVQIINKNPRIINIKSLNSEIFKKIVLGDINRRSQFLESPIQVARNRPNPEVLNDRKRLPKLADKCIISES